MTINETEPTNKINRFEAFHHYRKLHPEFYTRFETAVTWVLNHEEGDPVTGKLSALVLRNILLRDFPTVPLRTPENVDTYKAMLAWYRYKNPGTESRFRYRKTEKGRAVGLGRTDYWRKQARQKVGVLTVLALVNRLEKDGKPTSLVLLKAACGIKFNQNYNAEVADYIRICYPSLKHLLPARRPGVR